MASIRLTRRWTGLVLALALLVGVIVLAGCAKPTVTVSISPNPVELTATAPPTLSAVFNVTGGPGPVTITGATVTAYRADGSLWPRDGNPLHKDLGYTVYAPGFAFTLPVPLSTIAGQSLTIPADDPVWSEPISQRPTVVKIEVTSPDATITVNDVSLSWPAQ